MGLKPALIGTAMAFALAIYMLVAPPIIVPLFDFFSGGAVSDQGYSSQLALVKTVALVFVPTLLAGGVIIYVYAAIQRTESRVGGRAR